MTRTQGITALTTIPAITRGESRMCVDGEDPSAMPVELGEADTLVDVVISVGDEAEVSE
jgi:hypothetical protein